MKQGDWVRLVERGYSLDGTEEDWLGAVIEASLPLLDHGFGVVGWTFEPDLYRLPTTILGAHPDGSPHPPMAFGSRLALGFVFNRKDLENLHRADRPLITGADVMGGDAVLEHRYNQNEWIAKKVARFVEWEDWGIRDSERALGATPRGPGIGLVGPSRERVRPREAHRHRWALATVHLAAGLRLRRRLKGPPRDDGDAVLGLDGRVHHAQAEARGEDLRAVLRQAARNVDRARGALRRDDPDLALAMWRGLVDGRWSLVDRFDSDGRHFLVARRNAPELPDPRALTERERSVVAHAALGWPNKRIAYTLGIEVSTVGTLLARAMAKLGVRRAELVRLASHDPRDARAATLPQDEDIEVASFALEEPLVELTEAEREVARLAIEGSSNAAIAARRLTAIRTVANQLAAIYRKLGVGSRAELAARLRRAAPGPRAGGS